jgi:branched-chain amino acid transport system ATP-binding protein
MSKNPEDLLVVKDLEVFYGKIRAVKKISFTIKEGEIVALLGANGAGKSTTLLAISGVQPIGGGEITYKGRDLRKIKAENIVRLGIAQAPEGRHIYPYLSVMENLSMGGITRKDKNEVRETAETVFRLFPRLFERKTQPAGTLSGGEQQMLTIGRALMSKPSLLLLDEPSLGISPILTLQIFETLARINETGASILLVEQNAIAALEFASRAYVLETGVITLSGSSAELRKNESVRRAYLGE